MVSIITILTVMFFIGYACIALEHPIRIDKTATALLLGMLMWSVYLICAQWIVPAIDMQGLQLYLDENPRLLLADLATQCTDYVLNVKIVEGLGDISQTLFFLIGAMTIVELMDVHGGFTIITEHIATRNKRRLLILLCLTTFFFSAVLDNMTSTIVMILLLRKLVSDQHERWLYAGMIIIAANTGGAWSPIGDVTTIMLWVHGNVTATALITYVLLPSLVAMLVPMLGVMKVLKGRLPKQAKDSKAETQNPYNERRTIFIFGVTALLFVPIFKSITHTPPFIGILLSLGVLWVLTEIFYNRKMLDRAKEHRLPRVISRIDMPSILFFLGILMAVKVLEAAGILAAGAQFLDEHVHNVYVINSLLGVMSSIFDNVPLVAGVMGMYPIAAPGAMGYAANFVVDGTFWEFLSYCAGVGGSLLIIGSASGVIAMGLEKINFGWYLKRFTWLALLGYLAGVLTYILEVWLFKSPAVA